MNSAPQIQVVLDVEILTNLQEDLGETQVWEMPKMLFHMFVGMSYASIFVHSEESQP